MAKVHFISPLLPVTKRGRPAAASPQGLSSSHPRSGAAKRASSPHPPAPGQQQAALQIIIKKYKKLEEKKKLNRGQNGPYGLPTPSVAPALLSTATQPPRAPREPRRRPALRRAGSLLPPLRWARPASPRFGLPLRRGLLREGLHGRPAAAAGGRAREEGGQEAALARRVGGEAGAGPPRSAKDSPDRPGHFPRRFGPGPRDVAQR